MKKQHTFIYKIVLILTGSILVLAIPSAHSEAIANFTDGEGTTSPDQYMGTAGDGWEAGWNRRLGSNGTTTFSVLNTNPLNGGGNYLQVEYTRTGLGATNRAGVARPFTTGTGGVDMTKPYTISFDFRVDNLDGWNSANDQLVFSSESTTTIGAYGVDIPWSLTIRGDNLWRVTNGNGEGDFSNLEFTSLGLTSIAVNTVYTVEVFVDPINQGYDLVISAGANTWRASDLNGNQLLGFRTNEEAHLANVLQFRATVNDVNDNIQWSMDNIVVVPEPSATALLLIGGAIAVGLSRDGNNLTRSQKNMP